MSAMGMIEVEGVAGIVLAGDAVCKTAEVDLLGWTSIGGFTTLFFKGSIGAVNNAIRSGERAAQNISKRVVSAVLTQPEPICNTYVSFHAKSDLPIPSGALGLLETRGYGCHVRTNDAMVKAADVAVYQVLTVMNRVVCSLIIGDVAAVKEALLVGQSLVSAGDHYMGSAWIAQPVRDVLCAFGPQGGSP